MRCESCELKFKVSVNNEYKLLTRDELLELLSKIINKDKLDDYKSVYKCPYCNNYLNPENYFNFMKED